VIAAFRTAMPRSAAAWAAVISASVGVGWIATVGPRFVRTTADHALAGSWSALTFGLIGGAVFLLLALRAIAGADADRLLSRLTIYGYFSLLFLGVAALSALRLLKQAAWPIAVTQPLPTSLDAMHAFWIGAAGGLLVVGGVWAGSRASAPQRLSEETPRMTALEWSQLRVLAPVFGSIGLLGSAIIIEKTHKLVLFASDVDNLRYTQGTGLGYASLLEYELLLAACIAAALFACVAESRRFAFLLLTVSVAALVVLRAERTPVLVVVGVALFAYVRAGGSHRGRIAILVLPLLVALIVSLGLYRLQSSEGPLGRQKALVRAVYDVSPEFREASYVYRIYPRETPFIGSRAILADVAAVVPSFALRVVGVDKSTTYSDISHEYSATMHNLGIYPVVGPLRVGLGAELWADFGIYGFVIGLLAYGLVVGWVSTRRPNSVVGLVSHCVASVLLLFALITPTAALLPIALMLLGPLALLGPLGVVSKREYREAAETTAS